MRFYPLNHTPYLNPTGFATYVLPPSRDPHPASTCPLGLLLPWQPLDVSLTFTTWAFRTSAGQLWCGMPLDLGSPAVSHE